MKSRNPILLLLLSALLSACGTENRFLEPAVRLAQRYIIVDGHVDLPYRLTEHREDVSRRTATGDFDFDFPRARTGGLDAPFMSIYIPAEYQENGGAKAKADSLIDMVVGLTKDHPDKFALAFSPDDIRQNSKKGLVSFPMGMENGAPIEGELDNLDYFYDRGIRYFTLTHSKDNHISDSSYDTTADTHNGLSSFGFEVVQRMNNLGMMVDVSHLSDSAFYDVMKVTEAPVIASHSSARHFTPGWERNMGDEMIERLAKNGGLIMINFGSSFLEQESLEIGERLRNEISDSIDKMKSIPSTIERNRLTRQYFDQHYHFSTVQKVADHIDHVVNLVGINHVGLGSDFDGVGNSLPAGLKDVSDYPNLIAELLKRGYSDREIQKICSGNIFRVWEEVNARAATAHGKNE